MPSQITPTNQPLPDVRVIWGRMLLNLKKAGKIMLHTVCVELGKINLSGNSLTIYVPSIINYETLKKPQNYADLVDTLQKLGYNLNIEFVLDETAKTEQQDKVSRLSKILGFEIETI